MFKKNKKQTENVKEKKVRTVKVGTHKKTVIVLWAVLIASVSFGVYKNFTAIDQHTTHTEEMIIETVNLNGILESCISSYYSILKQNNITPQITIPNKRILGKGNENALSRILGNIISNAVKYSDGDLKIILTENRELLFSNHASGLTEIQVERLFDRFYTVNNARKSTGLGLSISKVLIEKMGGTISAKYENDILTIKISIQEK